MNWETEAIHTAIKDFSKAWLKMSSTLSMYADDDHLEAILMDSPETKWLNYCITEPYLNEFRAWRDKSLKNLENLQRGGDLCLGVH